MSFLTHERAFRRGSINAHTVGLERLATTLDGASSHCHLEAIVKILDIDEGTRILVLRLDCNAFFE